MAADKPEKPVKFRVLVLDDSLEDRRIITACLEEVSNGFVVECVEAEDLPQGLLAVDRCHAAVLDLLIPGAAGVETVRAIAGKSPKLPILVVSGLLSVKTAREAGEAGASCCIAKEDVGTCLKYLLATLLGRCDHERTQRLRLREDLDRVSAELAHMQLSLADKLGANVTPSADYVDASRF